MTRGLFGPAATAAACLVLLGLLGAGEPASARSETLRWSHPEPSRVDGFEVHYGTESGQYGSSVDVGRPTADAEGVFSTSVEVPDGATVYFAMRAYGGGETSAFSNELVRTDSSSGDSGSGDSGSGDSGSGDSGSGDSGSGDSGSDDSGSGDSGSSDPDSGSDEPVPGSGPTAPSSERLYFEDFESHATGTAVPSWLDTAPDNSMQEDDSLFAVRELGSGRVLSTRSSSTNIHSHYVGSGSSEWSEYELRGLLRIAHAAGGVGVTAYSHYDREDVYYRLRRYKDRAFELAMHPALACADPRTDVVPSADTWYRYRLRVETESGATRVRAKVWKAGAGEPSSWQAECHDASGGRPSAGTVGAWSMGSGAKYWDDLEVVDLSGDSSSGSGDGDSPGVGPPGRPVLVTP